jgi:L-amino acid N-acyltransferase YncA
MIFPTVRLIESRDTEDILNIYSHYILNTTVTFETEIPSLTSFNERIKHIVSTYPWIICEYEDEIVGYAYACKHRERSAYQWSVEVSVYLGPEYTGQGIGKILYSSLINILRFQGFINVYAGIALPNISSVGIHEKFGFEHIALYKNVGYKFRKWIDVGWWWLALSVHPEFPVAPTPIENLSRNQIIDLLT